MFQEVALSSSKIDPEGRHMANLLSLMLGVANQLSETDTFQRHGLTVPEWALLNRFPPVGVEIDVKKLANAVGLSPQRAKVLIAKLESRGTIQSTTPEEARGARRYAITAAGAALMSEADKALFDMQVTTPDPSQARTLARAVRVTFRLFKAPRRDRSLQ